MKIKLDVKSVENTFKLESRIDGKGSEVEVLGDAVVVVGFSSVLSVEEYAVLLGLCDRWSVSVLVEKKEK